MLAARHAHAILSKSFYGGYFTLDITDHIQVGSSNFPEITVSLSVGKFQIYLRLPVLDSYNMRKSLIHTSNLRISQTGCKCAIFIFDFYSRKHAYDFIAGRLSKRVPVERNY